MLSTLIGLLVLLLIAAQLGVLGGRSPNDLGVTDGRLKPPSPTPNSVSSQASLYPDHPQRSYAAIDPLPAKPAGQAASMAALGLALEQMPGVRVVERKENYLYAVATTRWLKFNDDIEAWFDPARQVIELRSASRLGRKDFGANRARVDALRAIYLALP
ncbi:DUF1499 domain-containing protein [Hydrogenophaga sp.]|uniref:DUF1499 domain-containing protein n=1 Tax=Hydrogenophaga sp. TaxID=1904254 RepID=UPI0025BC7AF7|nr:DUF1499 domain-containing protein [Hydrogenophaga sp.]